MQALYVPNPVTTLHLHPILPFDPFDHTFCWKLPSLLISRDDFFLSLTIIFMGILKKMSNFTHKIHTYIMNYIIRHFSHNSSSINYYLY